MNEINISNVHDLCNHFINLSFGFYRGVSNVAYELQPKVGRYGSKYAIDLEKSILSMFKEKSIPYLTEKPENEWEWLALAQHHSLPTHLLDWTHNPFVATYFAVNKSVNTDSAIYFLKTGGAIETVFANSMPDPFSLTEVKIYHPSNISARIIAQSALFTIHPNPNISFDHENIVKLIIPSKLRVAIKEVLDGFGIHSASLFPGLDGVAEYLTTFYDTLPTNK
ncbi:MAG: FRG domain-containing protein [Melioribacteraceae bacterium]|nr:FRG domain-containing protein [Melioribacteraceae bacterium]